MAIPKSHKKLSDQSYRNRVLLCIVFAEILIIALFMFWPAEEYQPELDFVLNPPEEVLLQDIEITRQLTSPPPPPTPRLANPVPSDEIIDVEIEMDSELDIPDLPDVDPGMGSGLSGDEERVVANPQIPPTVVRIVEATAPESVPEEYKGRLEMIVNFLVDQNGDVEEASIMEIRLYDENSSGEYEELPFIQYGLMDAVIKASLQWRFRPARQNGEPVKAFTRQRFNY